MDLMEAEIHELLRSLGMTANYKGYFYVASALRMCLEDPDLLHLVTKALYPRVAREYGTTWKAVERSIRTAVSTVWKRAPARLERLARCPLRGKPSASQFLAILTAGLACGRAGVTD